MELTISIIAVVFSGIALLFSIFVTVIKAIREKRQATLDRFNLLQEQVFDKINLYSKGDIKRIADRFLEVKQNKEYESNKKEVEEYYTLSGYLARIDHFSLGVRLGIYNAKVTEQAAKKYFVSIYEKLKPIINAKNSWQTDSQKNNSDDIIYYEEFQKLKEKIEKMENKIGSNNVPSSQSDNAKKDGGSETEGNDFVNTQSDDETPSN